MSEPYRPLFVELGRELMDLLTGITEQAIKRAEESSIVRDPRSAVLWVVNEDPISSWLQRRYGWKRHAISRCAYDRTIEVSARLLCGHVVKYEPISEMILAAADNPAHALIDALDRRANQRDCYCTPGSSDSKASRGGGV